MGDPIMKRFEVAVPLKHCNKVRIEPTDELGELMIVYKFPLDQVYLRKIPSDVKNYVLDDFSKD